MNEVLETSGVLPILWDGAVSRQQNGDRWVLTHRLDSADLLFIDGGVSFDITKAYRCSVTWKADDEYHQRGFMIFRFKYT